MYVFCDFRHWRFDVLVRIYRYEYGVTKNNTAHRSGMEITYLFFAGDDAPPSGHTAGRRASALRWDITTIRRRLAEEDRGARAMIKRRTGGMPALFYSRAVYFGTTFRKIE